MRRGFLAAIVAAALQAGAGPAAAPADAHALVQRADLPIPEWLFGWAAALVLIVSFGALAVCWTESRLDRDVWRALPGPVGAIAASHPALGCLGASCLLVVIWAGYAGPDGAQDNLAPTFILVIVWVGFVFASVLLGDVFRVVNPWRAMGRAAGALLTRLRGGRRPIHRAYPDWLGRWPAAGGLLVFTWIELASGWGDEPRRLVSAALAYSVYTLGAMALYGTETWARDGEAFGVYFNLFSRMSVFETRDGVVGVRPPLTGLARLPPRAGTVAVVTVMIGTVTFDGMSQGALWRDFSVDLTGRLVSLGVPPGQAFRLTDTVGLGFGVAVIAAFYLLAIAGARSIGSPLSSGRLRAGFIHSLVPIALVYVAAHYLTYLIFQGQAIVSLISDPAGRGWNLFGTASSAIDYGVISQNATWYVQVALVICGHVAALVLAHDRALALYGQAQLAVRFQYWILAVMVGFSTLALWLLAQANA